MALITMGELLDRIRDFEARLEAYYAEVRDRSINNNVRLLTYYLARHRHYREKALTGVDPELLQHICTTELTFDGQFEPVTGLRLPTYAPETVSGDTLIEAAIEYNHRWASLFRSILGHPLCDATRVVLEALMLMNEREIVVLKKMLAMHYF